jgi:hypothetical protein
MSCSYLQQVEQQVLGGRATHGSERKRMEWRLAGTCNTLLHPVRLGEFLQQGKKSFQLFHWQITLHATQGGAQPLLSLHSFWRLWRHSMALSAPVLQFRRRVLQGSFPIDGFKSEPSSTFRRCCQSIFQLSMSSAVRSQMSAHIPLGFLADNSLHY